MSPVTNTVTNAVTSSAVALPARLVHTWRMPQRQGSSRPVIGAADLAVATTHELVALIADGDARAEAELVERYSRGVRFLLRRITRDPGLAEDFHQETFRVVIERLRGGALQDATKLDAFVRATARNLFIGDYRKTMRRDTHSDSEHLERAVDRRPGQLATVLLREKADAVREAIDDLDSDRDRQILFRFYIAEDEKADICADLDLSPIHFNRVLFRARQRFKVALLRRGEMVPTGSREVLAQ